MAPKTRSQARTAPSPAGAASPSSNRKFYVEVPARPRAKITHKTHSVPLPACLPARSPVHPSDAPRDLVSTLVELREGILRLHNNAEGRVHLVKLANAALTLAQKHPLAPQPQNEANISASLKELTNAIVAQGRTVTELASTLRAPKPTPPATTPSPPVEPPPDGRRLTRSDALAATGEAGDAAAGRSAASDRCEPI